jgi:hypothetical protein
MAEMATYIGIEPRTGIANAAIARGLRCFVNASGTLDIQDNTARGDYVTIQDIEAAKPGEVASGWGGGKVPAVASEATLPGDAAYTATLGRFSKSTTSNVLVGRWILGASGAGVLGEVELE